MCVNPVFELANVTGDLLRVSVGALAINANDMAWDGSVLWLRTTLRDPATVRITFAGN